MITNPRMEIVILVVDYRILIVCVLLDIFPSYRVRVAE